MAFTKLTLTESIKTCFTRVNTFIDALLATDSGSGASQVGVYDAAGNMAADNVEDALAEIYSDTASTRTLAEIFDENSATTTGLTWGYKTGKIRVDNTVTTIAAGTIGLTDASTNYVEITQAGTVTKNTTAFTAGRIPIRTITTLAGAQTVSTDSRAWFVQVAAASTTVSGTVELATDTETITGTATDRATTPANIKAKLEQYVKVSDVKAEDAGGGTFMQDAWRTRDINTEDSDTGGICSISSNQITLAAGTYTCFIACPTYDVEMHVARLYNISDTSETILGTSGYSKNNNVTYSLIIGTFTIAAQKTFEIQHYCTLTSALFGFGAGAISSGMNSVFTIAEFRRT